MKIFEPVNLASSKTQTRTRCQFLCLLAKWSADEERWLRDNCKAFAAFKALALAPSTASTARAVASPAPASGDASPAPTTTRAQAKISRRGANKPPAAAAADAASTESDGLEPRDAGRASSARGDGKGRGRRTKFDALVSSPPEQRGN